MDKKIGLEHTIRNVVSESIGVSNTDKYQGTPKAFLKPAPLISPKKGDEHPNGSATLAQRGRAEIASSETMRLEGKIGLEHTIRNVLTKKSEEAIEEGWYNPQTGQSYASRQASMAASEELAKKKQTQRQSDLEAVSKIREKELKQMGVSAKNQNVPPTTKPAAGVGPQQAQKPKALPGPTEKPMQILKPKGTPIKTGAKVAAGWGAIPAVMGAVQRGTEAYAKGKGNLAIAGETALGAGEGLAAGLSYPIAAASNAGEAALKTVGLVKPAKDNEDSYTSTAAKAIGVPDPADSTKFDDPRGFNVNDPGWKKLEKTMGSAEKTAMDFDKKHSKLVSVPMAATSGLIAGLGAPWGAIEGGLAQASKTGLRTKSDWKKAGNAALAGAANYWKSGAEYPYNVYKNVMGEESRADIIRRVIKESVRTKTGVKPGFKIAGLHPFDNPKILKMFSHGAESSKNIDGYKIREYEGKKYWINDKGDIAPAEIEVSLNKKAKAMVDAESIGQQTGGVGSGMKPSKPETKLSPYQARQAEKLKGKAAGTELANLGRFADEPTKLAGTPEKQPPISGQEPQLQKVPEKKSGSSLSYADKPQKIEFPIVKTEPVKDLPMAGAEPQLQKAATPVVVDTQKTVVADKPKSDFKLAELEPPKTQTQAQTVVTDPRTQLKTGTLQVPAVKLQTKVVTDPRTQLKVFPATKTKTKTPTKTETTPPKRRKIPPLLGGTTPGQSVGVYQNSNVPVEIYKHMPKEYMHFEETQFEADAKVIKRKTRKAQIIRKIIDEKKAEKKDTSTVILNPKLKTQEPDQT